MCLINLQDSSNIFFPVTRLFFFLIQFVIMGLCRCPQRKVSTLFCFKHHVNVCESCLVTDHSQCIVRSYVSWLQDNDYNPNCSLCQRSLTETGQETLRLVCYFFIGHVSMNISDRSHRIQRPMVTHVQHVIRVFFHRQILFHLLPIKYDRNFRQLVGQHVCQYHPMIRIIKRQLQLFNKKNNKL